MRKQLNKLKKGKSTKSERRFAEILKRNRIPFETKIKICGREADFLIGNVIVEIDSHKQDVEKNKLFAEAGYGVIHFNNWEIHDLDDWIQKIWQAQHSMPRIRQRRAYS